MRKYKAAVAQIHTSENKEENLSKMKSMTERAAGEGARLICFPETANIRSEKLKPYEIAEKTDGPTISLLSDLAKKNNLWLCCGSMLEYIANSEKAYNTSILLGPDGDVKAVYRKCHAFDVTLPDGGAIRESDSIMSGEKITTAETELGNLGIAICYDLRFPEQFREMTKRGMQVLLLPASFTDETGKAHWEFLLRARAVENGCYVLASDQCGDAGKYNAHGHSMIIDPWGRILAKAGYEEELLFADIDLDYAEKVRGQIPSTIEY